MMEDKGIEVNPKDLDPVNSTSRRESSISTIPLSSESETAYPMPSGSENMNSTEPGQTSKPVESVKSKVRSSEEVKKILSAASNLSDYKMKRTLLWVLQTNKNKRLKGDSTTSQLGKN